MLLRVTPFTNDSQGESFTITAGIDCELHFMYHCTRVCLIRIACNHILALLACVQPNVECVFGRTMNAPCAQ